MKTATFSEFRNHAGAYLDAVENGETVQVLRHGRPVAMVTPVDRVGETPAQYWVKRKAMPRDKGLRLSDLVLQDRKKARF